MTVRISFGVGLGFCGVVLAVGGGCKRSATQTRATAAASRAEVMANVNWRTQARGYRGRNGLVVTVTCPPSGPMGTVWGSDIYSDDSSVCGAAFHSGRVNLATGGTFQIRIMPGQQMYVATVRNGMTTAAFGPFAGSFAVVGGAAQGLVAAPLPTAVPNSMAAPVVPPGGMAPLPMSPGRTPWATNATIVRGQNNRRFTFLCPPGGVPGSVWGTGTYTDDSSVCSAAVHAGVISLATGGPVTLLVSPGLPSYTGSLSNGVTSRNYGNYAGSFTLVREPPGAVAPLPGAVAPLPGTTAFTWMQNAAAHRGQNGQTIRAYCPPGGAPGMVWGTGIYTDDSSVCGAAVHAGLITPAAGGAFTLRIMPGRPAYTGSLAHDVTTQSYAEYPGSFAVQR